MDQFLEQQLIAAQHQQAQAYQQYTAAMAENNTADMAVAAAMQASAADAMQLCQLVMMPPAVDLLLKKIAAARDILRRGIVTDRVFDTAQVEAWIGDADRTLNRGNVKLR